MPALVFLTGLTQHQAQGTSLFVLSLPVVVLGMLQYWNSGNVNWKYGIIIALTFVVGAIVGSKLSLKLSPSVVKFVFGLITAYVSFKLILSGYQGIWNEK